MTDEVFEEIRDILREALLVCLVDVGVRLFSALRKDKVELERKLTERQQAEIESQLWSA